MVMAAKHSSLSPFLHNSSQDPSLHLSILVLPCSVGTSEIFWWIQEQGPDGTYFTQGP